MYGQPDEPVIEDDEDEDEEDDDDDKDDEEADGKFIVNAIFVSLIPLFALSLFFFSIDVCGTVELHTCAHM